MCVSFSLFLSPISLSLPLPPYLSLSLFSLFYSLSPSCYSIVSLSSDFVRLSLSLSLYLSLLFEESRDNVRANSTSGSSGLIRGGQERT